MLHIFCVKATRFTAWALLLFASLRIGDGYADHYYAEHYDALAIMTQSRFLSCFGECVNVEFKLKSW